jgi:hypothetical protein
MKEDKIATTTVSVTVLTPDNYHRWIKEIKRLAEKYDVWNYVDPEKTIPEPKKGIMSSAAHYQVPVAVAASSTAESGGAPLTVTTRPATGAGELFVEQRRDLKSSLAE